MLEVVATKILLFLWKMTRELCSEKKMTQYLEKSHPQKVNFEQKSLNYLTLFDNLTKISYFLFTIFCQCAKIYSAKMSPAKMSHRTFVRTTNGFCGH